MCNSSNNLQHGQGDQESLYGDFRTIPGLEDRYEASNFGFIRSFCWRKEGKILKPFKSGKYLLVTLRDENGIRRHRRVHRLVYSAFFPSEELGRKYQIHHRNGNTLDNRICNLQRVTPHEHFLINLKNGTARTFKSGSQNQNSKLTEADVVDIRRRFSSKEASTAELAEEYHVSKRCIQYINCFKTWKHLHEDASQAA